MCCALLTHNVDSMLEDDLRSRDTCRLSRSGWFLLIANQTELIIASFRLFCWLQTFSNG